MPPPLGNGRRRAGGLDDLGGGAEEVLAFQDQVVLEHDSN